MRTAQLLIHESESKLTALLSGLPATVRHPRTINECLEMVRPGEASVLVIQLGKNLELELGMLAQVSNLHPDLGIVVIGELNHAPLVGLAWDLGASYVLLLPQPRELIVETVDGLLRPGRVEDDA